MIKINLLDENSLALISHISFREKSNIMEESKEPTVKKYWVISHEHRIKTKPTKMVKLLAIFSCRIEIKDAITSCALKKYTEKRKSKFKLLPTKRETSTLLFR
jgi:hypothetical protein